MKTDRAPLFVAIVGGSGSGKTWLAQRLHAALGRKAGRLSLDDFYRDQSHVTPAVRARINFDHPRAIDWERLESVLRDLLAGRTARLPAYDFKTHCRVKRVAALKPAEILLVEGLWLLRRPSLRRLFGYKVFVNCPMNTRLQRRLARDLISRGRTPASVRRQFRATVQPMHRRFVESQKRWADLVVPHDFALSQARDLARTLQRLTRRS